MVSLVYVGLICWLFNVTCFPLTLALFPLIWLDLSSFLCQSFCNLLGSKVYLLYLLLSIFSFWKQSFFLCHQQPLSDPFHLLLPSFLPSQVADVFSVSLLPPFPPLVLLSHHFPFLVLLSQCVPLALSNIHQICLPVCLNIHNWAPTHTHLWWLHLTSYTWSTFTVHINLHLSTVLVSHSH